MTISTSRLPVRGTKRRQAFTTNQSEPMKLKATITAILLLVTTIALLLPTTGYSQRRPSAEELKSKRRLPRRSHLAKAGL